LNYGHHQGQVAADKEIPLKSKRASEQVQSPSVDREKPNPYEFFTRFSDKNQGVFQQVKSSNHGKHKENAETVVWELTEATPDCFGSV